MDPQWNDLDFLKTRNAGRAQVGKRLDNQILERMLEKFEPRPETGIFQQVKLSFRRHEFSGISVDLSAEDLASLWMLLSQALPKELSSNYLCSTEYEVPSELHVTTFHRSQISKAYLAEFSEQGKEQHTCSLTVDALAFVPGCVLCALVTSLEPSTAMSRSRRPHITLASRLPCKPQHSNNLLELFFSDETLQAGPNGDAWRDCGEGDLGLCQWRFPGIDLDAMWDRLPGTAHELDLCPSAVTQTDSNNSGSSSASHTKLRWRALAGVKVFPEQVQEASAFLLKLPKPLVLTGSSKRFFRQHLARKPECARTHQP